MVSDQLCVECLYNKKRVSAIEGSLFCLKCQPKSFPAIEGLRSGYYLAAQQLQGGDPALAQQAQAYYCQTLGLDPQHAGRYDGATLYGSGSLTLRVVLQNFFADQLDVKTHDYAYSISEVPWVCGYCGGNVIKQHPEDDFLVIRLRGEIYECVMPTDIWIPKCDRCLTVYLGNDAAQSIAHQMGGELP